MRPIYKDKIRSFTGQTPPHPNQTFSSAASKKKLMEEFSQ
jgi:hypothetical protein